jgi:hypothetical protein
MHAFHSRCPNPSLAVLIMAQALSNLSTLIHVFFNVPNANDEADVTDFPKNVKRNFFPHAFFSVLKTI